MTRQQAISRWKDIASAVFWAEENLSKEWNNRLKEAPSLDKEKQHQLADAYLQAIATEIVSKTTDEELARWES